MIYEQTILLNNGKEALIRNADESDGNDVFEDAQVVGITMQGQTSYQLTGNMHFEEAEVEIPDSDVELVASQTSVSPEAALAALKECKGDIAEAILKLTAV